MLQSDVTVEGHIVLTGPMGAGKSTMGKHLALMLNRELLDSDMHIETSSGTTGRDIAAVSGVAHLHDLEHEFVKEAITRTPWTVIAGAASVADVPDLLASVVDGGHTLIYLDVDAALEVDAAEESVHRRPIGEIDATRLTQQRREHAVAAGALVVAARRISVEEMATQVMTFAMRRT